MAQVRRRKKTNPLPPVVPPVSEDKPIFGPPVDSEPEIHEVVEEVPADDQDLVIE